MAAGATYEPIATTTLGSSTSGQIFFSSIPQTYTDLRIIFTTTSSASVYGYYNNDTSSSYSGIGVQANGSTAVSTNFTNFSYAPFGGGANIAQPSMHTIDIFNYTGSTYKTSLSTSTADLNGSGNVIRRVCLWRNTAAITSIGFVAYIGGTFQAGTTATLYGIKAA